MQQPGSQPAEARTVSTRPCPLQGPASPGQSLAGGTPGWETRLLPVGCSGSDRGCAQSRASSARHTHQPRGPGSRVAQPAPRMAQLTTWGHNQRMAVANFVRSAWARASNVVLPTWRQARAHTSSGCHGHSGRVRSRGRDPRAMRGGKGRAAGRERRDVEAPHEAGLQHRLDGDLPCLARSTTAPTKGEPRRRHLRAVGVRGVLALETPRAEKGPRS